MSADPYAGDTPQIPIAPTGPELTPHPPTSRKRRPRGGSGMRGSDLRWLVDLLFDDGARREARLVAALREARRLCDQVKIDLSTAHAEICKLQNLDEALSWPEWTPQANTLRWVDEKLIPQIDAALAKVRAGAK